MLDRELKRREDRLRRKLDRKGYRLSKSRTKGVFTYQGRTYPLENDLGLYMVIQNYYNVPCFGQYFSASLEEVEQFAEKL